MVDFGEAAILDGLRSGDRFGKGEREENSHVVRDKRVAGVDIRDNMVVGACDHKVEGMTRSVGAHGHMLGEVTRIEEGLEAVCSCIAQVIDVEVKVSNDQEIVREHQEDL